MSLKNKLCDFLNKNQSTCEDLMYEHNIQELNDMNIEYDTVDSYGGEEQGRDYYTVVKFTSKEFPGEEVFAKFQGWYESYNGSEYEEWFFVEPKQKVITVYEEL